MPVWFLLIYAVLYPSIMKFHFDVTRWRSFNLLWVLGEPFWSDTSCLSVWGIYWYYFLITSLVSHFLYFLYSQFLQYVSMDWSINSLIFSYFSCLFVLLFSYRVFQHCLYKRLLNFYSIFLIFFIYPGLPRHPPSTARLLFFSHGYNVFFFFFLRGSITFLIFIVVF